MAVVCVCGGGGGRGIGGGVGEEEGRRRSLKGRCLTETRPLDHV